MSNQPVFPQIRETSKLQGRASYEKKCIFHERILYHYIVRKIEGWSVADFFRAEKIETHALYAVTDFTELFIKDLERNDGGRSGILCDKNAKGFGHDVMGYKVLSPEEMVPLYKNGEIQKIIIMSVLHENEIIEELLKKGVLLYDMISIISVLYS